MEYTTVAEAISAVEEGQVIVLQSNVTESITISKNVTIDLNGFKLTNEASKATIVVESGKLIVNDSSTNGEVIQNGKGSYNAALFVKPGAKAELNGGFFNSTDVKAWYTLKNCGELTINDGVKVYNNSNSSSVIANGYSKYGDYNNVNGTTGGSYPENVSVAKMTINGGAYTGKCYVKNDDYGLMTVNGGEFTISTIKGAALMNAGTMVIGSADGKNVPVFKGSYSVVLNFDEPSNKVADPGLLTVNAVKADDASVLIGTASGCTIGEVILKDKNVWNGEIISVSNGTVLNGSLAIGEDGVVFVNVKAGTNGITVKAGSVDIFGAIDGGNFVVSGEAVITGDTILAPGAMITVSDGATLTIEEGATFTNNGTLNLDSVDSLKNEGTYITGERGSTMVGQTITYIVDSYVVKNGITYKVRSLTIGSETVYYGIANIKIQWDGEEIDKDKIYAAGAEMTPLGNNEGLEATNISFDLAKDDYKAAKPGIIINAIKATISLKYNGSLKTAVAFGDLEVTKADLSTADVNVDTNSPLTYDGEDKSKEFEFTVTFPLTGQNVKVKADGFFSDKACTTAVDSVADAGKYYVKLTADNDECFDGSIIGVEVVISPATTSVDVEKKKDWTADNYTNGNVEITVDAPVGAVINAEIQVGENGNPIFTETEFTDAAGVQSWLDQFMKENSTDRNGITFTLNIWISNDENYTGSEAQPLEIIVGAFEKFDAKLDITSPTYGVQVTGEGKEWNVAGTIVKNGDGKYIVEFTVSSEDAYAIFNAEGDHGCNVRTDAPSGIELSNNEFSDGNSFTFTATISTFPVDGKITIALTPNEQNVSINSATYTIDLSALNPDGIIIVLKDVYGDLTFVNDMYGVELDVGSYFLLPAPAKGGVWNLGEKTYAGGSIYVVSQADVKAGKITFNTEAVVDPEPGVSDKFYVTYVYGTESETIPVEKYSKFVPLNITVEDGVTVKWYIGDYEVTENEVVNDNMVVVAKFVSNQPATVKITFVYGMNYSIKGVEAGAVCNDYPDASKQGYEYKWYVNGEEISEDYKFDKDTVVIADYYPEQLEPTEVKVTFIYGMGNHEDKTVKVGETCTFPNDAADRKGYTLAWYVNEVKISEDYKFNADTVVVAFYEKEAAQPSEPESYKVTWIYEYSDGTKSVTKVYEPGQMIGSCDEATEYAAANNMRVSWKFAGDDKREYNEEMEVREDMVLYAVYEKLKSKELALSCDFDSEGNVLAYNIIALDGGAVPMGSLKVKYQYTDSDHWFPVSGHPDNVYTDYDNNKEIVKGTISIPEDRHVCNITVTFQPFDTDAEEISFDIYVGDY